MYLALVLLSSAAIVTSFLLGSGTVAPQASVATYISAIFLLIFEYLGITEWRRTKGRRQTVVKTAITAVMLSVSVVPQAIIFIIASLLWMIVLPILGILSLIYIVRSFISKN